MKKSKAAALAAAGTLAVTATLFAVVPTVSAFTDQGRLNPGSNGLGGATFDILSVLPDGTVAQARPGEGVTVPIPGDDGFVPGRTITVDLGVANNSPLLAAAVTIAVKPADAAGTGQVAGSPNITPFIRVTVVDSTTGQLLVGGSATDPSQGAAVADATGAVGRLAARGAPALADGGSWIDAAAGSRHDLTVTLFYVDTPETAAYNGGQTALEVEFDGASTP